MVHRHFLTNHSIVGMLYALTLYLCLEKFIRFNSDNLLKKQNKTKKQEEEHLDDNGVLLNYPSLLEKIATLATL